MRHRVPYDQNDDNDQSELQQLFKSGLPKLKTLLINILNLKSLQVLCENHQQLKILCISTLKTLNYTPIYKYLTNLEQLYVFGKHLFSNHHENCDNYYDKHKWEYNICNLKKLKVLMPKNYAPGLTPRYFNSTDLQNVKIIINESLNNRTNSSQPIHGPINNIYEELNNQQICEKFMTGKTNVPYW